MQEVCSVGLVSAALDWTTARQALGNGTESQTAEGKSGTARGAVDRVTSTSVKEGGLMLGYYAHAPPSMRSLPIYNHN